MRWLFCVAWRVKGGRTRWGAGRCGERTERCRWQRKRSERVAAVKILSVRRKAAQKFWAPQQGHRPLRKRYKECDAERNPPVTASPCQPPLGKGAMGTGGTDCHGQCSHWPRNDIGFLWGCGVRRGTWAPPYKSFRNIAGGQGRPPLRKARRCEQARTGGVEPRPYGSATRGAMGGRPQGSPLRKRYKECDFYRAGRCRHRPLRGEFGENKRKKQEDTGVPSCF